MDTMLIYRCPTDEAGAIVGRGMENKGHAAESRAKVCLLCLCTECTKNPGHNAKENTKIAAYRGININKSTQY